MVMYNLYIFFKVAEKGSITTLPGISSSRN